MASTSIFADWLKFINLSDHHIIFELYDTVKSLKSCGNFQIKPLKSSKDQWEVYEIGLDYNLLLLSEEARQTFLRILDSCTPQSMGVEAYYSFKKAMEKDD